MAIYGKYLFRSEIGIFDIPKKECTKKDLKIYR